MDRTEQTQDIVDLGDALALTRGTAMTNDDDGNGTLRKGAGISDED